MVEGMREGYDIIRTIFPQVLRQPPPAKLEVEILTANTSETFMAPSMLPASTLSARDPCFFFDAIPNMIIPPQWLPRRMPDSDEPK